jgi:hypothetical protein
MYALARECAHGQACDGMHTLVKAYMGRHVNTYTSDGIFRNKPRARCICVSSRVLYICVRPCACVHVSHVSMFMSGCEHIFGKFTHDMYIQTCTNMLCSLRAPTNEDFTAFYRQAETKHQAFTDTRQRKSILHKPTFSPTASAAPLVTCLNEFGTPMLVYKQTSACTRKNQANIFRTFLKLETAASIAIKLHVCTTSLGKSTCGPPIRTLSGDVRSWIAVPSARNSGFDKTCCNISNVS